MRESEYRGYQARAAKRDMLLLNQWEFIETRQRAMEKVLGSLSLWDRLMILMGRLSLKDVIDSAHILLFKAIQKERAEAMERAKDEARKPKLIIPAPGVNGHARA